jgi:hypothetical protein
MKSLLVFVFAVAINPLNAHADPCTGIQAQLGSIAGQPSHGESAGAERVLGSLEAADPDCDELVLERVRLQATKGDDAADDTFAHYTTFEAARREEMRLSGAVSVELGTLPASGRRS